MSQSDPSALEELDRLSPYEVAVLAFTSPMEVDEARDDDRPVVLTGKESYLWAGAVAHVLIQKPDLEGEEILGFLQGAVLRNRDLIQSRFRGTGDFDMFGRHLGMQLVGSFVE